VGQTLWWLGAARGSQHAAPAALCLLSSKMVGLVDLSKLLLTLSMLPSKTSQSCPKTLQSCGSPREDKAGVLQMTVYNSRSYNYIIFFNTRAVRGVPKLAPCLHSRDNNCTIGTQTTHM
jgi:hypothetical protein